MRKNKIEGVQPFNKFYLKSCYYHQLVAGLACFGISVEGIVLGSFVFPKKHFEIEKISIPEKTLGKVLGFQNKRCNLSKKQLLCNIDKQRPIIVGVDCFYYESRPDTYQKLHDPHYVLVYGYDLDNGTLNVVDHRYKNSFEYIEKIISLDNLLYANKMFCRRPLKRKKTANVLKELNNKQENLAVLSQYNHKLFQQAKEDSAFNLEVLKSLISQNSAALSAESTTITQYLEEMKNLFSNFNVVAAFNNSKDYLEALFTIIGAYSNLLSIFWRMESKNDYGFAFRYKENLLSKIDALIDAENLIYDFFTEICKCQSKK